MHTTHIIQLGPRDCPYTLNGKNLVDYRRGDIHFKAIAEGLGVYSPDLSKNELLTAMIHKLKLMNAETEIMDMLEEG